MNQTKSTIAKTLPLLIIALSGCASLSAQPHQLAFSSSGVLTDSQGKTLYIFDKDQQGKSNCYSGCAQKWPPVLSAKIINDGEFSTVSRKDGSLQMRYKNQPLYLWVGDKVAGDKTGEGVKGVWHSVLNAPAGIHFSSSAHLVNQQDMSVYTFDKDKSKESVCYGMCAEKWPPVLAQSTYSAGRFSTSKRKDGNLQINFDSKPLYLWIGDKKPGDISGDGVKSVWHKVAY